MKKRGLFALLVALVFIISVSLTNVAFAATATPQGESVTYTYTGGVITEDLYMNSSLATSVANQIPDNNTANYRNWAFGTLYGIATTVTIKNTPIGIVAAAMYSLEVTMSSNQKNNLSAAIKKYAAKNKYMDVTISGTTSSLGIVYTISSWNGNYPMLAPVVKYCPYFGIDSEVSAHLY